MSQFSAYVAAHRFGLGESYDLMPKISNNPKRWLESQLEADSAKPIKGRFQSTNDLTSFIGKLRKAKNTDRERLIKEGFQGFQSEMSARFRRHIETENPLQERLVQFWSNHFTVSFKGKNFLAPLVGAFEREAIRPNIFRPFSEMLIAVMSHPAMLIYLDNVQSIGPNSLIGRRRSKGLNENLAREILELHTLGVNGGYNQNDVIGLARILTGWMITPPQFGGGGFRYVAQAHEPGDHKVLGKTYRSDGQKQGIKALKDIADHPSTARFISEKLARHFISDTPSNKDIDALSTVYQKHDGNLRKMITHMIGMGSVWSAPLPKLKTPYEMIVAHFRLLGLNGDKIPFKHVINSLSLFDHAPFQAPSPAGWPDKAEDWLSPNAMMNRVEWCQAFAQRIRPTTSPEVISQHVFKGLDNKETQFWISRAPSAEMGLALLLSSPAWQRR